MSGASRDFFVGWTGKLPAAHAGFLRAILVALLVGLPVLAGVLARANDDTGTGGFDWDAGAQTLRGTVTARPYPLLHLAGGHTLMLSGVGKSGVDLDPALDGRNVEVSGFLLKRGTLDMLLVDDLHAADGNAVPVAPAAPLGTWRLTGEICDGKCYTGAMRPGSGLSHRACANLCLIGGVPPVFVTTAPVAGTSFLLLADADGAALPDSVRDLAALRIQLDGKLERRGDLLVFRTDLAQARRR